MLNSKRRTVRGEGAVAARIPSADHLLSHIEAARSAIGARCLAANVELSKACSALARGDLKATGKRLCAAMSHAQADVEVGPADRAVGLIVTARRELLAQRLDDEWVRSGEVRA